ncbi:hypothetical protein AGLY_010709 [Aphis glycines]|uniref:MULE transposase domain-containing protein n=1 Tax=Aphis glycines TaxID=307491 RepID=A0A6G0TGJ5_APHGL|nr:hypothetical protein AGLY_010709 [Aphis glycines]
MNFEIVAGERQNNLVIYQNEKFFKTNFVKYLCAYKWKCINKKCNAKIYINESLTDIVKYDVDHQNHEKPPINTLKKKLFSNQLKRKLTDFTESPTKIINREILKNPQIENDHVNNIKQCIHRERRKHIPTLPKNLIEVIEAMNNREIKTVEGESFLIHTDLVNNMMCFSTDSNLKALSSSNTIFVDGTFSACPMFFYQLFTIHVNINGHYVPLVFFLLPNKTTNIYALAFSFLKTKCDELNLNLNLTTIMADFEESIHAGAKIIWPLIQIIGCRFHLIQSWWRKIQEIGLTNEYKNKTGECGIWLRKIFGLSFLNPEEVSDCFIENFMAYSPNDPKILTFCDYLTENYIDESSRFPPNVWASFSISSERTTNSCESFHAKLNSLFTKSHPNIYLYTF